MQACGRRVTMPESQRKTHRSPFLHSWRIRQVSRTRRFLTRRRRQARSESSFSDVTFKLHPQPFFGPFPYGAHFILASDLSSIDSHRPCHSLVPANSQQLAGRARPDDIVGRSLVTSLAKAYGAPHWSSLVMQTTRRQWHTMPQSRGRTLRGRA